MAYELSNVNEQVVKQSTTLSHNQIQAVRVLQYPGQELQNYITKALRENPALEGEPCELCPFCHFPLSAANGQGCDCVNFRQSQQHTAQEAVHDGRDDWDMSLQSVRGAGSFDEDDEDPLNRVSGRAEYGAGLLTALHALIPTADYMIAEYLVGSLDSHGLLALGIVNETADVLAVTAERVETVLTALQQLDPPGIGARSPREALLIQLKRLRDAGESHELAELLLQDHFEDLAAKHFREIARIIGKTPRQIEQELNFIAQKLHPHPAHGFDPDLSGVAMSAPPVRPDVVIRRVATGFEADIVEQRRWSLRLSDSFSQARLLYRRDLNTGSNGERDLVRRSLDDATNLLQALKQRWMTMQRVADALIALQWSYLERGPSGLRPLTRKDVGDRIGLHESTVSRATDGKFVLLPNGKTVPFDDFFNDSLLVKDAIIELIECEDVRHPFSDEQLTGILNDRGMDVARRTVAKYREELSILPSRLRRNRLAPRQSQLVSVTSH